MSAANLKSVRDDAMALQDYLADLKSWEKDIKKEDQRLLTLQKEKGSIPVTDTVPIRGQEKSSNSMDNCLKKESLPVTEVKEGKERILSSDYAAWDKYDADAAVDTIEKQACKLSGNDGDSNTEASDEDKLKAVLFKDEGNKLLSSGQYSASVTQYSQGLALDNSNHILFANRAMAYIKLEQPEAAVRDCDACLRLSPNYLKAWLRRGAAHLSLGRLQHALEDYQKVLEVEPWNKDAKQKVVEVKKKIMFPLSCADPKKNKARKSSTSSVLSSVTSKDKEQKTTENSAKRDELASATRLGNQNMPATPKASSQTPPNTDPDILQPASKPHHLRSQKPLRKLQVVDVASEMDIPPLELTKRSRDRSQEDAFQSSKVPPEVSQPTNNKEKSKQLHHKSLGDTLPSTKTLTSPTHPETPSKSSESSSAALPPTTAPQTAVVASHPKGVLPSLPPLPRTSHQFMSSWSKVASHPTGAFAWLQTIKPTTIRGFELEIDCISSLVSTFSSWLSLVRQPSDAAPPTSVMVGEPASVRKMAEVYLEAVTESRAFELNVLFLTSDDKTCFLSLLSDLERDLDGLSPRLAASRQLLTE